jgi:3-oxoacyl-[acyl-carrier-protein] synthase-1
MRVALHVSGIGMVTAVGDDTHNTIVALAAGARRIRRAQLCDMAGDRISGAFAFPVRAEHEGFARASVLAWPALVECLDEGTQARGPTALLVCTPLPWGARGGRDASPSAAAHDNWPLVMDALAAEVEARGTTVPDSLRILIRRGHAGGILALRTAAQLFERGQAGQAVIVGLDTHGEPATLEHLDKLGLLKSRRSPNGFMPGEAAAALCVRPASGRDRGAGIRGIGIEVETQVPAGSRAMTTVVSQAIEAWGGDVSTIGAVAIDLNGEADRQREWCAAATQTIYKKQATPVLLHPADRLGDIGAASVPLLVGLVVSAQTPGPALVVASSRDGLRGAAVVA